MADRRRVGGREANTSGGGDAAGRQRVAPAGERSISTTCLTCGSRPGVRSAHTATTSSCASLMTWSCGVLVKSDAERFWAELAERFRKFHLALHPEKTRLLEFGPYAAEHRTKRGLGKPETFNFLGFTHICGKKRSNGRFTVIRQTIRKRLQAKLSAVKAELRRRMHDPIPAVGAWLRSVVGGHIRSYGMPSRPTGAPPISVPSRVALASCAVAPESERPRGLGPDAAAH